MRAACSIPCCVLVFMVIAWGVLPAWAEYERPVSAAPRPADIGEDYVIPPVQRTPPRTTARELFDVAALAAALGVCAWLVLKKRNRALVVGLTIVCVAYFGFYRQGCVCPIGAIQNVAASLAQPDVALSYVAIAIFFLPLVAALLFGRVFCGGVCPLGAVQELLVLKPVSVPRRIDKSLGSLKWVYLLLAIWFATRPATARDFIICRFDPFVGFFRFTGSMWLLLTGGALLAVNLFVGRPYCRYLCPYGALLSLFSRLAWRPVTITPDKELDCGLCAESCPYGAIKNLRAERGGCLACARCFWACPRERMHERADAAATTGADS